MRAGPRALCIQDKWQGRLRCPSKELEEGTFQRPRQEPEEERVHGITTTKKSPMGGPEKWLLNDDKVRLEVMARQGPWRHGHPRLAWPVELVLPSSCHLSPPTLLPAREVVVWMWWQVGAFSSQCWRGEQKGHRPMTPSSLACLA